MFMKLPNDAFMENPFVYVDSDRLGRFLVGKDEETVVCHCQGTALEVSRCMEQVSGVEIEDVGFDTSQEEIKKLIKQRDLALNRRICSKAVMNRILNRI